VRRRVVAVLEHGGEREAEHLLVEAGGALDVGADQRDVVDAAGRRGRALAPGAGTACSRARRGEAVSSTRSARTSHRCRGGGTTGIGVCWSGPGRWSPSGGKSGDEIDRTRGDSIPIRHPRPGCRPGEKGPGCWAAGPASWPGRCAAGAGAADLPSSLVTVPDPNGHRDQQPCEARVHLQGGAELGHPWCGRDVGAVLPVRGEHAPAGAGC
jgi:hypothetical protein